MQIGRRSFGSNGVRRRRRRSESSINDVCKQNGKEGGAIVDEVREFYRSVVPGGRRSKNLKNMLTSFMKGPFGIITCLIEGPEFRQTLRLARFATPWLLF